MYSDVYMSSIKHEHRAVNLLRTILLNREIESYKRIGCPVEKPGW